MSTRRANSQAKASSDSVVLDLFAAESAVAADVGSGPDSADGVSLQVSEPTDQPCVANSESAAPDAFAADSVMVADVAAGPDSADGAVSLQAAKPTHQPSVANSESAAPDAFAADSMVVADAVAGPDAAGDAVSLQAAKLTHQSPAANSKFVAPEVLAAETVMVEDLVAGPDAAAGAAASLSADASLSAVASLSADAFDSANSKRSPRFPQRLAGPGILGAGLSDGCGMGAKTGLSLNSPVLSPIPQSSSDTASPDTPPERQQPKRKQTRKPRSRSSCSDHPWPGAGPKEKAEVQPRPAVQRWYTPGETSTCSALQDLYSIEDLRRVTEELSAMMEVHGTSPADLLRVPQDRPSRQMRSEQEPGGDDGKGGEAREGGPGP